QGFNCVINDAKFARSEDDSLPSRSDRIAEWSVMPNLTSKQMFNLLTGQLRCQLNGITEAELSKLQGRPHYFFEYFLPLFNDQMQAKQPNTSMSEIIKSAAKEAREKAKN